MNTRTILCKHSCPKGLRALFASLAFTGLLQANHPADPVKLQELPPIQQEQLTQVPKNVARWHMGTTLTRATDGETINLKSSQRFPEGPLLSDDETGTMELPAGKTEFILTLAEFHKLSHAYLQSYGAAGTLSIATSTVPLDASDSKWEPLVNGQPFSPGRPLSTAFASAEAKFVRLTFDVQQPGPIGNLSITGDTNVAQTPFDAEEYNPEEAAQLTDENSVRFDFASLHAGSAITHISGGDPNQAQAMIDDDTSTSFSFGTEGGVSALVLDLSRDAMVDAVSLLMTAGKGTLNVYTFPTLPESLRSSETGTLELTAEFFNNNTPTRTFAFAEGGERAAINLDNSLTRYVLLEWEGDDRVPLSISEISVSGRIPDDFPGLPYYAEFEFAAPPPSNLAPPETQTPPPNLPNIQATSQ